MTKSWYYRCDPDYTYGHVADAVADVPPGGILKVQEQAVIRSFYAVRMARPYSDEQDIMEFDDLEAAEKWVAERRAWIAAAQKSVA